MIIFFVLYYPIFLFDDHICLYSFLNKKEFNYYKYKMSLKEIITKTKNLSNKKRAEQAMKYFKTGPG
jgi:hypothetical protein